jgi:hypothetical protein
VLDLSRHGVAGDGIFMHAFVSAIASLRATSTALAHDRDLSRERSLSLAIAPTPPQRASGAVE